MRGSISLLLVAAILAIAVTDAEARRRYRHHRPKPARTVPSELLGTKILEPRLVYRELRVQRVEPGEQPARDFNDRWNGERRW